ncbi:MAG TPA: P-loop NTPase, partial [archaeon]|nr:P-loop NTPase [archaeon]
MTTVVSIVSGKGGVGKTTTTLNLAAALAERNHYVTAVDGNLTTPNIGLHLGIQLFPTTLHDVLQGKTDITKAVYIHESG